MKGAGIFFSIKEYKKIIKKILIPNEIYDGVEDIQVMDLYDQGFRTIFLDVDNTIMTYAEKNISLEKERWVEMVKQMGFDIFLISNNSSKKRLKKLSEKLDLQGIYFSLKPLWFSTKEFIQKKQLNTKKIVVIGDQVLTDIIYGNWLRAYTILVNPLEKKLSFFKVIQKKIETAALKKVDGF